MTCIYVLSVVRDRIGFSTADFSPMDRETDGQAVVMLDLGDARSFVVAGVLTHSWRCTSS